MAPDPKFILPAQLAERKESIAGKLPIAELERLRALLYSDDGVLAYRIEFRKERGIIYLTGEVDGSLMVICQRCLNPMEFQIESTVQIAIVQDETALERVSEPYEPLLQAESELSLLQLIEDEVLLGLPISPMHPPGGCPTGTQPSDEPEGRSTNRQRPFAVLKDMNIKTS